MDPFTWTFQCWPTNKNLPTAVLCEHRTLSRGLLSTIDDWDELSGRAMEICASSVTWINGYHSRNAKLFVWLEHSSIRQGKMYKKENYNIMPYYSRALVCQLVPERYDSKSNVKRGGFQSQLEASSLATLKGFDSTKQSFCRWQCIYIYI